MTALQGLSTIYLAIIYFYAFNERLGFKFIFGITVILIGLALFSIQKEVVKVENTTGSTELALFYGMLNPIIIAVMLTLPRYITDNYNYPAQKLTMDSLFILGLGGTPFMLYYWN